MAVAAAVRSAIAVRGPSSSDQVERVAAAA